MHILLIRVRKGNFILNKIWKDLVLQEIKILGVSEFDINDAELNLKKKEGISTVKQVRKDPFEVSK